jgi:anti-anti-sigma factor
MKGPYQQIDLEHVGDVVFARFRHRKIDESGIHTLGNELTQLIESDGCRKLIIGLGPGTLECLYSVFLAKLVMIQRRMHDKNGVLIVCELTPEVKAVFEACKLMSYFEFAPDKPAALAAMAAKQVP